MDVGGLKMIGIYFIGWASLEENIRYDFTITQSGDCVRLRDRSLESDDRADSHKIKKKNMTLK